MALTALLGSNPLGTIASALNGSQSAGESTSSAGGSNWGYNTAQSINRSQSSGYSNTYGTAASERAANAAAVANKYSMENMNKVMEYNSMEAQKQREWEERMANTIYTRSVANMKEAGINPILAASMGLSGASVGSGATASVAQPQTFMGQTFADQNSANQAWSAGDSYSHGENGGSWGSSSSSWNNSESGLATGLRQMSQLTEDVYNTVKSSQFMKDLQEEMNDLYHDMRQKGLDDPNKTAEQKNMINADTVGGTLGYYISKFGQSIRNGVGGFYDKMGLAYSKSLEDIPANTKAGEAARKFLKGETLNKSESEALRNYYIKK